MVGIVGLLLRSLYEPDVATIANVGLTASCPSTPSYPSTPSLIVAIAVPSTDMVVTPLLLDAVITGVCPS
jgi:hypothetical protein